MTGTFARRNGAINMDIDFANKSLQPMSQFAIQLNKNSFGLVVGTPLSIPVLQPSQTLPNSLLLNTNGGVQKMSPISNLQVQIYILALKPYYYYYYFKKNYYYYYYYNLNVHVSKLTL